MKQAMKHQKVIIGGQLPGNRGLVKDVSSRAARCAAPLLLVRRVSGVRKALELPFDPIDRAARIWEHRFGPSSAMAAVTSIMRAQQILLGELDAILRPYGLTFARYEALVLLSFSRAGALPLRVMGERLMVHPTSVTNTIDRLEAQGMVIRRPNPEDGRGRLAEITERGRDAVRVATRDLMAAEFGMREYSEPERAELFGLLRGLRLTAGDFIAELNDGAWSPVQ
jgi:DNA-binding MarR family transcriptional regulator